MKDSEEAASVTSVISVVVAVVAMTMTVAATESMACRNRDSEHHKHNQNPYQAAKRER